MLVVAMLAWPRNSLDVRQWHAGAQHLHRPGLPKLMRMDPIGNVWALLSCCGGMFIQQIGDIVLAHQVTLTGPDRIEEGCFWYGRAGVELAQVLVEVTPGLIHDRDRSGLPTFPVSVTRPAPGGGVDVCRCQVKDLLNAGGGVEDEQHDGGVSQTPAGVLSGCSDQRVDRGHRQPIGRMDHGSDRPDVFDIQPDRDQGRVFCGAIGEEGLDRGQPLAD